MIACFLITMKSGLSLGGPRLRVAEFIHFLLSFDLNLDAGCEAVGGCSARVVLV